MAEAYLVCEVRYHIDRDGLDEFKIYAQTWKNLIERHGGKHDGYLISRQAPIGATMSFPGVGHEDTSVVAVARFTFPDDASYLRYREEVGRDPDGIEANSRYRTNPPFKSYERTFLEHLV